MLCGHGRLGFPVDTGESPEAYDRFLHRFLFNMPGIRQTRTIVALREIKHEQRLPL